MAIPGYQSFMGPLLEMAKDKNEHSISEAYDKLSKRFSITEEEKNELLTSETQPKYKNRIGWAKTYLVKAGLLESTRRGFFRITDRGLHELGSSNGQIDSSYLQKFVEFNKFKNQHHQNQTSVGDIDTTSATPEELIERSISELNSQLGTELLEALMKSTPSFFERVVVELLVSMGYGGTRKEAGRVVGKSGDGGIDGIIKEDRLGLDAVYIQAKRWENVVSRPEIQKFVGALQGRRARKGIFITTSRFSTDARDYVKNIESRVVLIDGEELTQLMIEHDVGTTTLADYHIKRIDADYFTEFE